MCLTVVAVLVDLRVRANLHRSVTWHLWDPSVQVSAHFKVVMLIDAFELLRDAQLLITRLKGHLGLPREHPTYSKHTKGG